MFTTIKLPIALFFSIFLGIVAVHAQQDIPAKYSLIPYPKSLSPVNGTFTIGAGVKIIYPIGSQNLLNEAKHLQEMIKQDLGVVLPLSTKTGQKSIILKSDKSIVENEGYTLNVSRNQIEIAGKTNTGVYRGIETLRQLLLQNANLKVATIPCLKIADAPAFDWRGMHLDVSRHFFSIQYLKKFIDVMSLYKMNKFHLHLTDDQGWRIEIKKYPLLTEKGAWRTFNGQDSVCMKKAVDNPDMEIDTAHIIKRDGKTLYGGYYTQAQLKDLIKYAQDRHIEIIPEIDMPGHMMAAINAYPYLSTKEGAGWGKDFSTPICPCKESTFEFAENVFAEVAALFPSKYIHLGADEVERTSWAESPLCKAVMKANNLKTTAELQSYFVKRMEKFFHSKGKELIGWDEILEGGVSKTALVMYWRGWVPDAPIKAAKNGNKVIMTPGNPLYFDVVPDRNSIFNVYHFEPVPKNLNNAEAKYILGAQANIWTEYIPSEKRADYMFMPRMTALAEVLWTHQNNYESYLKRLDAQYPVLDKFKVNYRIPDLTGFTEENVFNNPVLLKINKPLPALTIRYTKDGSLPNNNSSVLTYPFEVSSAEKLKIAAFGPAGNRGDIYNLNYKKQDFFKSQNPGGIKPGLILNYFGDKIKSVADLPQKSDTVVVVPNFTIAEGLAKEGKPFSVRLAGYLEVPETGIYSFYLTADDGANLYIDEEKVIDNDGWHYPIQKSGQVALEKGIHTISLPFVEAGGGYTLKLEYSLNSSELRKVPDSWLKYK